jgi:hypothetical protein
VDAAKRVASGELFDVVVSPDAIDKLIDAGVRPGKQRLASGVAVAVRSARRALKSARRGGPAGGVAARRLPPAQRRGAGQLSSAGALLPRSKTDVRAAGRVLAPGGPRHGARPAVDELMHLSGTMIAAAPAIQVTPSPASATSMGDRRRLLDF